MADKKDQQTEQNVDQTVEQQQAEQQAAQAAEDALQQDAAAAEAETAGTSADQTDKIAELELALSKAEAQVKEQRDSVLRTQAEMENVRRRASQDVEKAHKFALEKFANELLTSVDNLERALQLADQQDESSRNFIEGIELTYKSLTSTLEKFGVKAVGEEGEAFNPDLHQAMSMQESSEHSNNTIMAVMQKGYELNGRLLRPAMVMVARNSDSGVDTKA
ncbi:nucleotide exchange factor GrpE [Idiomarina piscisalsi]|uniref:Protein GrpE n=1 Tax=Idiomarina piscisalsi TaxID=1096243 RepID=A0ABM6LUB5_9GAMM|nr:nucleotide exchange factor GrpE [Idiomarina piscisalsi]ASG66146.1 nucleotide exchange factor GrpE [Idiomarina piscisalsi]MTJ01960.1 nucleotide exchange factor GrpE [Idiomarina piscisalsi]